MKIGIYIDNVISNFNDILLKEYLKHGKELRNTGIINEEPEYLRKGMFDWSKAEDEEFYNKKNIKVYPVYYPIGNGMMNIEKTIEDIKFIIETN